MNKKLLVFPMVAILGLTGCKNKGPSLKDVDFRDEINYGEPLTQIELNDLYIKIVDSAKRYKGHTVETESFSAETSNQAETTISSLKEVDLYSNKLIITHEEESKETKKSGVIYSYETDTDSYYLIKDKTVLEYSQDALAKTSTITATHVDDEAKTYNDKIMSDANSVISDVITAFQNGTAKDKFGKVSGGYEFTTSTVSDTYSYTDKGNTIMERNRNVSQTIYSFDSDGELSKKTVFQRNESSKDPLTGEYTDDLILVSKTKSLLTVSYGEKSEGDIPSKLTGKAYVKSFDNAKIKVTNAADPSKTESSAYTDMTCGPIVENLELNNGKGTFMATLANGQYTAVKPQFTLNYTKLEIGTEKVETVSKSTDAIDLSAAFQANGVEIKTAEGGGKYIPIATSCMFVVTFDYSLVDGILTVSNPAISNFTAL